jgi:predicted transcriptional regulator
MRRNSLRPRVPFGGMKMPRGYEIRAGRSLLGWQASELARHARVDTATVYRVAAAGSAPVRAHSLTVEKIVTALEREGVEFIEGGVRLVRKPRR